MNSERVIGVIPALNSGFLGRHAFTLVTTDQRLIFSKVTNELIKQEHEKNLNESKGRNEGFLGKWKASIASGFAFHERYWKMSPQDILNELPDNYEIRLTDVKSVKLRKGSYYPESGTQSMNKMIIKWTGGKKKFRSDRMDIEQVKKILIPVLGPKVK